MRDKTIPCSRCNEAMDVTPEQTSDICPACIIELDGIESLLKKEEV